MIADKYLFKLIEGETFHIIDQDGTPGKLRTGAAEGHAVKDVPADGTGPII